LMRFLTDLGVPLPVPFHAATELVLNANLKQAFAADELDVQRIQVLLGEAKMWKVELDAAGLSFALKPALNRLAEQLRAGPADLEAPERLAAVLDMVVSLPFEVDLWRVQNVYYDTLQTIHSDAFWNAVEPGHKDVHVWLDRFTTLGEKLGIRVAEMKERGTPSTIAATAQQIADELRIPTATYRLQFNSAFTFRDAEGLVPYLYELGISDCYASPLFKANPGSDHGYDVCDYSQLNPSLGSEKDFAAFADALRSRNMGLIFDMVPNHMGINQTCNAWWMDVLENGPGASHARYFDIDWAPVKRELANRVLLPILEDQYGTVLESGKLQLSYEDGAFYINYYDRRLPVAPPTYSIILRHELGHLAETLGRENEHVIELQSILTALSYLPSATEQAPEKIAERNREKEIVKRRIATLYEASPTVRAMIDTTVRAFNGTVGDRHSFDLMDSLLAHQNYRPAFWRVAMEEINFRRFFDINELAAVRVELPSVFQDTHELAFRFLSEGKVTGLRIDHPDGLWNPPNYFHNLQEAYAFRRAQARLGEDSTHVGMARAVVAHLLARAEQGDPGQPAWPLYVVTEKILADGEPLPEDWPVFGTTGYDFLNTVNSIFVDAANRRAFDEIYANFIGNNVNFRNLVNSTKKMVMLVSLASEINSLSYDLERIAERNRRYRDFTLNSLTFAIREIVACLPVYRTYIVGASGTVSPMDQRFIEAAVAEARRRNPRTAHSIFDFVRDTLLLRRLEDFSPEDREKISDFGMKFQQVTGPVMAKGVEDTAFYVYNRLVSLNEVGGNPAQFGASVADFHQANVRRAERWPHTMLATSTHDTKRGEDTRARIDVLSEIPDEWAAAIARWSELNAPKKTIVDGEPAPDNNEEYLL
ncbi:MAG: malto-oligosyltrehalose synthase, partial [Chloroflexota bacterium]